MELITKTEAVNALTLEHRNAMSSLEDKLAEMINLCNAKDSNSQRLESEMIRLQRQLQRTTETPGERKSAPRSIVISSPVKPASSTTVVMGQGSGIGDSSLSGSSSSDAQLLTALRNQVSRLTMQLREADAKNGELTSGITAREQELTRLSSRLLEGDGTGAAGKVGQLELVNQQHQRLIAQLNDQVDFLNEQLAQRELQLSRLNDKCTTLETQVLGSAQREELVSKLRQENDSLVTALRATEGRVQYLQHAMEEQKRSFEDQLLSAKDSEQLARDELDSSVARLADELRAMKAQPNSPPPDIESDRGDEVRVEDDYGQAVLAGQFAALKEHYEERGRELNELNHQLTTNRVALTEVTSKFEESTRRVTALEAQLKELEAEAEEARMFREISEAELRRAAIDFHQSPHYASVSTNTDPQISQPDAMISAQGRFVEASDVEVDVLRSEIMSLRERIEIMTSSASNAGDTEALQLELQSVERHAQMLMSERQGYQDALNALQEEVSILTGKLKERDGAVTVLEEKLRSASNAQISFNNRAVALVEERDNLAAQLSAAWDRITELSSHSRIGIQPQPMMQDEDRYNAILAEISKLRVSLDGVTTQRDDALQNSKILERDLEVAHRRINELKVSLISSSFPLNFLLDRAGELI